LTNRIRIGLSLAALRCAPLLGHSSTNRLAATLHSESNGERRCAAWPLRLAYQCTLW